MPEFTPASVPLPKPGGRIVAANFFAGSFSRGCGLSFGMLLLSILFFTTASHAEESFYTHVAERGDSLIKIAKRFLIKTHNWQALQKINQVDNPNLIPVGTRIRMPVSQMRTELANAEVIALQGSVTASSGTLAVGSAVKEGDKLKTGDTGFVSIRLADGSILKVQSKSSIQLENARQLANTGGVADTVVRLESGRVETSVAKQKGPSSRYEIRTPTSNMGVRGTVFRVAGNEAGTRALSEVVEGSVAVSSSGQPKLLSLPAGFGSVVEAGKPPSAPIALLPAPDLSGIAALTPTAKTRFQFPALAMAKRYRGQVATDANFNNLIADAQAAVPMIELAALPDGKLYLRIRGIDENDLEGNDAVKTVEVRATPVPPFLATPAPNAQVPAGPGRFEWAETKEAVAYQIQIDRQLDRDGKSQFAAPLVDKRVITGTAFSLDAGLTPGQYQWRVASVRGNGDVGPFSDAQAFAARDAKAILAVPRVKGNEARFSWGGVKESGQSGGQFYQFQLSRNDRFTDIVIDRIVDKPEVVADRLSKNVYYIRVRAVDVPPNVGGSANISMNTNVDKSSSEAVLATQPARFEGFKGPWSETQQVEIYASQWWLLMFGLPILGL